MKCERRQSVIRSTYLVFTPLLAGIVFVQSSELTVVALVQGEVLLGLNTFLADLFEDNAQRLLGTRQVRGECEATRTCQGTRLKEIMATYSKSV